MMRLKEVAEFITGFGYKQEDLVEHSNTKIARITNLYDLFEDVNYLYIPDKEYSKYSKYSLVEGDLVLTTVGSWPDKPKSVVGQLFRIPANAGNLIMARNMTRIRSNGKCNQDYLYYLLLSSDFKNYCMRIMKGSAKQACISIGDIEKYEFSMPNLEEQKQKVELLISIDRQIENYNAINRKLIELKDVLLTKEFSYEVDE